MDIVELNDLYDRDYFIGNVKSNYDNYVFCKSVLESLSKMVLYYLPEFDSLFDAGCAYGFVMNYIKKSNKKVRGCDCSEWAVSFCPDAYVSSIDDIPEKSNSYDIVSCFEVLEHIPELHTDKCIQELYRVAKKYIIMTIGLSPETEGFDSTHCTLRSREWWLDKFKGYDIDYDIMDKFDNNPFSIEMKWSNRFFVIRK